MILLDTSVLVAAYRRQPPLRGNSAAGPALRRMIESGLPLGIPASVLQEVLAGVRNKTQLRDLRAHLMAFRILPATIDDHVAAAKLAAECAGKRIPCTNQAALIVAQAARGGWQLYTFDRDLTAVAGVGGVQAVHARGTAMAGRRGK